VQVLVAAQGLDLSVVCVQRIVVFATPPHG
jgi:hypothetical protein